MAAVSTPTIICSCSSSSSSSRLSSKQAHNTKQQQLSFDPRKRFVEVGIGLLASSVIALTPFQADATRIEYYATTADPPCEFSFARSGLGYCDIAPGSGVEAPYGELINVSLQQLSPFFSIFLFHFFCVDWFIFDYSCLRVLKCEFEVKPRYLITVPLSIYNLRLRCS